MLTDTWNLVNRNNTPVFENGDYTITGDAVSFYLNFRGAKLGAYKTLSSVCQAAKHHNRT